MTAAPDFEEIYRRLEAVAPEELAAELRHPIGQAESVLANAEAPVAARERAALALRRAGWCMDALEKGDAASAVYHAVRLCQAAHDAAYMAAIERQLPHEPLFSQRLRRGLRALRGDRAHANTRRAERAARMAEIADEYERVRQAYRQFDSHGERWRIKGITARRCRCSERQVERALAQVRR